MFFFSGKFGGPKDPEPTINGPNPHVLIFANREPTPCMYHSMAADRWKIVRLPNGKGVGQIEKLDWQQDSEAPKTPLQVVDKPNYEFDSDIDDL